MYPMDEAHVDRPPFSKWPLDEQAWAGLVWHMQVRQVHGAGGEQGKV